jgi:hypothetical protein
MVKTTKGIYVDIQKWEEWEEYCEKTGRTLSKLIPIAVDEYIKKNK